ncbi:regulatory protein RecX [[Clostridium] fimetarium]|uniref:Regulatory protein RecX n=1 Tax=[Clostridium] fimetarium TaxID=99656 RepID=A0A1I0PZL2_9FIRM|nr:RecX family transcriptional regulator [[Clostridium] fimetarium]SEW19943.1 regulatory protein [[Clostridium] fimetarium]
MDNDEIYLVTEIVEINKKKRRIYINYDSAFSLYVGEVRKYKIKKDLPIDKEIYDEIVNEILPKRAKLRAMNLLKDRDLTEHSLRGKLKEGYYPEDSIRIAIEYVKSYGYIDDRRYAQNYVNFKSVSKSRYQIKNLLLQKGLDKDLISEVCDEYYENSDNNENSESKLIEKLISKRKVDIINITREDKSKLLGYLTRRGFRIDLINGVISEIVNK